MILSVDTAEISKDSSPPTQVKLTHHLLNRFIPTYDGLRRCRLRRSYGPQSLTGVEIADSSFDQKCPRIWTIKKCKHKRRKPKSSKSSQRSYNLPIRPPVNSNDSSLNMVPPSKATRTITAQTGV